MTNRKKLVAVLVLVFTLGITAFADCPVPGQMETPPCTSGQMQPDEPTTAPGQIETPPVVAENSSSVSWSAFIEVALNALTLF
jgi:hypothetical protein